MASDLHSIQCMTNQIFQKYSKLIKAGLMTEQELISFRKAINGPGKDLDSQVQDLLAIFESKAESKGIRLTDAQQAKGILWLKRNTYKLNGQLRKNPVLGYFEQQVVAKFSRFVCVGLYDLSDNAYRQYVPVYRCIARNGMYFDYICKMWGEIEVVSLGDRNGSISHKNQPEFELARKGTQSDRMSA